LNLAGEGSAMMHGRRQRGSQRTKDKAECQLEREVEKMEWFQKWCLYQTSINLPSSCILMPKSEASLDLSSSSSEASYGSDEDFRLAQMEWVESIEQLQQLVSVVLLPFFGKWLGRRWSQWAFARYLRLGLGKSFFLGAQGV